MMMLGKNIPKRLEAVFKRPGLLIVIEKYQELGDSILDRIDSGDELFSGLQRATVVSIISDMQTILKAELPYAVCDWCEGVGCEHCKGKGWIGRFVYDMTPRKEQ